MATPRVRQRAAVDRPLGPGPRPQRAGARHRAAARPRRRHPRRHRRRPVAREAAAASRVLYAPPDGIGPAQAKYIYSETVDRETYVATLMYAAEKEAVDLDPRRRHLDDQGPQRAGRLGRARPGHRSAPPTSSAGRARRSRRTRRTSRPASGCKDEIALLRRQRRDLGRSSSGNLVTSRARRPGRLAGPRRLRRRRSPSRSGTRSRMTMIGLIPGAFAVCGASLMATGSGTKRTRAGPRPVVQGRRLPPDAVDAVEQGALRLLRPRGALHGLHPVGGRPRLRQGVGREVPHRDGHRAAGAALLRRRATPARSPAAFVDSMVGDFGATVDSAISSYNATQQSSSSSGGGGGGFSGGGGGGGGGGGSW